MAFQCKKVEFRQVTKFFDCFLRFWGDPFLPCPRARRLQIFRDGFSVDAFAISLPSLAVVQPSCAANVTAVTKPSSKLLQRFFSLSSCADVKHGVHSHSSETSQSLATVEVNCSQMFRKKFQHLADGFAREESAMANCCPRVGSWCQGGGEIG
jgi:hypothetical protein